MKRQQVLKGSLICGIGALFYCYEYLLRIVPGVMQAELRVAFGNISATAFGTLTAFYYFAYTPMQLPAGMMMDRFGPHKLLSMACLLCALGSLMFSQAGAYHVAVVGRFLVGLGSAFAFVGVLKLANNWLPKTHFSLIAGLVSTLGMLGAIAGEVGMSSLVVDYGWREVLVGSTIIGFILTVVMFVLVKDSPKEGGSRTLLAFPLFFRDVWRVLRSLQVWLIGLVGSILYLSLSVFAETWGKSYLMTAHGLESIQAAKAVSMVFLGWAFGGPLLGFFADWLEQRVLSILVCSLLASICIAILLYVPDLSLGSIGWILFFYGFFCSIEVVVFALAKDNCRSKLAGTVFAVVNMIVMLGGAVLQPLVGRMLDSFWDGKVEHHIRIYSAMDYELVMSFLPLSLLIVGVAVFFISDARE